MTTSPRTCALTAGSSAGCLYYLQPLLHKVAGELDISTASAALLVSAAQIGYLSGLALLVPLGDFLERRRMVPALLVASFAALAVSAAAPNFALLVFDLGVQGIQLSNQSAIYALDPAAPSRLTTAYMVSFFLGGVAGSVGAGAAYQFGGWSLVCGIGLSATLLGLLLWAAFARSARFPGQGDAGRRTV